MPRGTLLSPPSGRGISRRRFAHRLVALGFYVNDPGIPGATTPGGNRGLTVNHITTMEQMVAHSMSLYMVSYPWAQGGFDRTSADAAKAAGKGYCELWRCNSYQTTSESSLYNCLNVINNGQPGSGATHIGVPTELSALFPIAIGDGTFYNLTGPPANPTQNIFRDYVTAWALGAKAYGLPVYVRLFHEFNLNTAPFNPCAGNSNNNTAAQFVQAWQTIVNWVRAAGATNVQFVWNPSANGSIAAGGAQGSALPFFIACYPGDYYVNQCALDSYNQCSQVTTATTPTVPPVGGYSMNAFTGTGAFGGIQFLDTQATAATSCTIAAAGIPTFGTNSYTTAVIIATSSDPNATVTSITDTHHGAVAWAGAKMKRRIQTPLAGVMEVWVYDRFDDQVSGTLHPGVTVNWSSSANVGFSYLLISGMAVSSFDTLGSAQGTGTVAQVTTDLAPAGTQDVVFSILAAYTNQAAAPAAPITNVAQSIGLTQFPAAFSSSRASAPDRFVAFVPNAGMPIPLTAGATPTYGPAQMRGLRFMGYFADATAWGTGGTFNPGDIVSYAGTQYVFQKPQGSTSATPSSDAGNPASAASWNNADGLDWTGTYQSGQTYNRLDCVYYNAQYWACTASGVKGVTPGTDSTKWYAYTPVGAISAWQLGTSSPWGAITLCLTALPHSLQTEQGNTTATTGNGSIPGATTPWNGQFKWNSFAAQFGTGGASPTGPYQALLNITTDNGALGNAITKPWWIAEMGSSAIGGNKSQWIIDAFLAQIKVNYPQISAVVWWHDVTQLYVAKGLAGVLSVNAFRTISADPIFAAGRL